MKYIDSSWISLLIPSVHGVWDLQDSNTALGYLFFAIYPSETISQYTA